jgi:hypothetical protein
LSLALFAIKYCVCVQLFEPKRKEVTGDWSSLVMATAGQNCLGDGITEREIVGECEEFERANGRGIEHSKDVGVDGRIILN